MDYREQQIAGKSWRRAHQVVLRNPLRARPSFTFHEEDVIDVQGTLHALPNDIPGIRGEFTADSVIPIINPNTGEPTGATVTQAEVYVILHSLYIQQAALRDEQEAE